MGNHKGLIDRLRKYSRDYVDGRTQDFSEVFDDCIIAANALDVVIAERDDLEQECNTLKARLEHLLLSDTVSKYDAKNHCGGYLLDIGGLDRIITARNELINENTMLRKQLELCCDVVEPPECADERAAPAVQYICDRRACEVCNFECKYTEDIRHAKHFELFERTMFEQEG